PVRGISRTYPAAFGEPRPEGRESQRDEGLMQSRDSPQRRRGRRESRRDNFPACGRQVPQRHQDTKKTTP
ncbi:MAG: hypothetical protein QME51_09200, partial [Planctomycetota bacterium]|nr:hypothetical protein [Planctomycetota bacterium]